MPIINIEFNDQIVSKEEIEALSSSSISIVSELTEIKDVFVYANSAQIKQQIAPIEMFIQMTASKIDDNEKLAEDIASQISDWKKKTGFLQPINMSLLPMDWVVKVDI